MKVSPFRVELVHIKESSDYKIATREQVNDYLENHAKGDEVYYNDTYELTIWKKWCEDYTTDCMIDADEDYEDKELFDEYLEETMNSFNIQGPEAEKVFKTANKNGATRIFTIEGENFGKYCGVQSMCTWYNESSGSEWSMYPME